MLRVPLRLNSSLGIDLQCAPVRNAIAHKNGNADRQLKSACPWLKVKLNQPVPVSHEMLHAYTGACMQYLVVRLYDVGDRYATNLRPDDEEPPRIVGKPDTSGC